jgi:hypothetical protein
MSQCHNVTSSPTVHYKPGRAGDLSPGESREECDRWVWFSLRLSRLSLLDLGLLFFVVRLWVDVNLREAHINYTQISRNIETLLTHQLYINQLHICYTMVTKHLNINHLLTSQVHWVNTSSTNGQNQISDLIIKRVFILNSPGNWIEKSVKRDIRICNQWF